MARSLLPWMKVAARGVARRFAGVVAPLVGKARSPAGKSKAPRRPGSRHLDFDCLESRDMPSTASFSGGVLSIIGTPQADRIHLRESASRLTVDGFSGSISVSQIRKITIDARGGDDVVTLDITPALATKV